MNKQAQLSRFAQKGGKAARALISFRASSTRKKVELALRHLVSKHPYDDITVQAICRQARVSRSTFYAHFRSKDAVKRAGVRRLIEGRDTHCDGKSPLLEQSASAFVWSDRVFEHARENVEHVRSMRGGHGADVGLRSVEAFMVRCLRQELRSHFNREDEDFDSAVLYAAAGCTAVLRRWLERGAPGSPRRMARIVRGFVERGCTTVAAQ